MPLLQTFGSDALRAFGFGGGAASFELIQTQVLASAVGAVSFSAIAQQYKHLQIRYMAKNTSTTQVLDVTLNGVTAANYSYHYLLGTGAAVSSAAVTGATFMRLVNGQAASSTTSAFNAGVIDLLDYTNANKNTTMRALTGDAAQNVVALNSGLYAVAAAVTSVTLTSTASTFAIGSRFSLYGVRGQ